MDLDELSHRVIGSDSSVPISVSLFPPDLWLRLRRAGVIASSQPAGYHQALVSKKKGCEPMPKASQRVAVGKRSDTDGTRSVIIGSTA